MLAASPPGWRRAAFQCGCSGLVAAGDLLAGLGQLLGTGRTHQLRVHMAYIGTPITGDRIYGKVRQGDRLFLHAQQLEIATRVGEVRTFVAPIPDEFVAKFPELS